MTFDSSLLKRIHAANCIARACASFSSIYIQSITNQAASISAFVVAKDLSETPSKSPQTWAA